MATPNYAYEKRQRELAKKNKKADKAKRRDSGAGAHDAPAPANVSPDLAPNDPARPAPAEG